MQLSSRLERILTMTEGGASVADIGTDHGYVPVELVRRGLFSRALACDVRRGPLERARDHIRQAGLAEQIEIRLGDGLQVVAPGEADTLVITGMGGPLMASILETGAETAHRARELILSPQSDIGAFRKYVLGHGFRIMEEDMIEEDGKFYVLLRCVPGTEESEWSEEELFYGRKLLRQGHPVLRRMLEKEIRTNEAIVKRLERAGTENSRRRLEEVEKALKAARRAQEILDASGTFSAFI